MTQNFDELERQFPSIFQSWHIEREIGRGSFGEVYEVWRESGDSVERAAIKHISYPRDQYDLQRICSDLGTSDEAAVKGDIYQTVQEFRREYQLMRKFSGQSHVVSCDDFQMIQKKDMPGYDIFIRMELLVPVSELMMSYELSRDEVVRLGIHICDALELLESEDIIHRDIKPENLFVNDFGDYKLGDFGAARSLSGADMTLSVKGTPAYMAPEIATQQKAGPWTDVYSLGLVMYRLVNRNQPPFVEGTQSVSTMVREKASSRRIGGEPLPLPANADPSLAGVILKACAYEPKDRYQTAGEFRKALEKISPENIKNRRTVKREPSVQGKSGIRTAVLTIEERKELDRQEAARRAAEAAEAAKELREKNEKRKKRTIRIVIIAAACVAFAALAAIVGIILKHNADRKALYRQAQQYEQNGEYDKAEDLYTELGTWKDAADRAKDVNDKAKLKTGKEKLAENRLLEAEEIFAGLEGVPEAQELLSKTRQQIDDDKQLKEAAGKIQRAETQYRKGSRENLNAASEAYTAAQAIYNAYAETDETAAAKAQECAYWIRYIKAEISLMDKKFSQARFDFSELADAKFRDAAERVLEVDNTEQYDIAEEYIKKEEYAKALPIYADLAEKGFAGAAERREETQRHLDYLAADKLLQNGAYEDAAAAFEKLGSFGDSEKAKRYALALQALKEKRYADAAQGFAGLGDYRDAKRIGQEAATMETSRQTYETANTLFAQGSYQQAKAKYDAIPDYENAKAMSVECGRYLELERAKELMSESSYSSAYSILKDLNLENSEELAEECQFGIFCSEASNMREPGTLLKSCYRYIYDQPLPLSSRQYWAKQMTPRDLTGAGIASSFANAPQFNSTGMTGEQLVKTLYDVLLNRSGRKEDDYTREHGVYKDAQVCVDYLNAGMTQTAVLDYIVRTREFAAICRQDALPVGAIEITENRDRDYGITRFLMDCYGLCLRRRADPSGLNTYSGQCLDDQVSLERIMIILATSPESQSYYPEDDEYIRMLYRLMLGREAVNNEVDLHRATLERGVDREELARLISDSPECANYLDKYLLTDKQRDTIRSVNGRYNQAIHDVEIGEYEKARKLFLSIPEYRDSAEKAEDCRVKIFCRDMAAGEELNPRITRCYETIAQFAALKDETRTEWASEVTRSKSGVEIIRSYIAHPHFSARGITNAERASAVWYIMLGSRPEAEDELYRHYISALDIGMDAEYEAFQISLTAEYRVFCALEGIDATEISVREMRDVSYPLTYLVDLSYRQVLKREASAEEKNYWCGKYMAGEINAKRLMTITLGSAEAGTVLPTMEEYIQAAYLYTLDRAATQEEIDADRKKTRKKIAEELTNSDECTRYLKSIGLK